MRNAGSYNNRILLIRKTGRDRNRDFPRPDSEVVGNPHPRGILPAQPGSIGPRAPRHVVGHTRGGSHCVNVPK